MVWHVDSYSLTPALLDRGLLDSRELRHLFWLKQKAPQWLFSETQTEMEMAGILGLDVSGFLYLKNLHC